MPSCSRPSVSDDHPFSAARFTTLTDHPGAPSQPCERLAKARHWVAGWVDGYNETHRHRARHGVTPGQRHRGEDHALLEPRRQVDAAAQARHPARWSGESRPWAADTVVCLNPGRPPQQEPNATRKATEFGRQLP